MGNGAVGAGPCQEAAARSSASPLPCALKGWRCHIPRAVLVIFFLLVLILFSYWSLLNWSRCPSERPVALPELVTAQSQFWGFRFCSYLREVDSWGQTLPFSLQERKKGEKKTYKWSRENYMGCKVKGLKLQRSRLAFKDGPNSVLMSAWRSLLMQSSSTGNRGFCTE